MKKDKQTLKLSDAFEDDGDGGKVNLELEVTVININTGFNEEIIEKCLLLRGYVRYIDIVEATQKRIAEENPAMNRVQAREKAIADSISYCKKHKILKDFFEKLSPEEVNMLTAEWNLEDAIKVAREESWERGREDGWERGREDGWEKGREDGWEKGRHEAAKNALKEGLSVEQTARITGIPADELLRQLSRPPQ
jgi:predicted transposase/invertase (TIGR01784 family)